MDTCPICEAMPRERTADVVIGEFDSWKCSVCGPYVCDKDAEFRSHPRRWLLAATVLFDKLRGRAPPFLYYRHDRELVTTRPFPGWRLLEIEDVLARTPGIRERMDLTLQNIALLCGTPERGARIDRPLIGAYAWSPTDAEGSELLRWMTSEGELEIAPYGWKLPLHSWLRFEEMTRGATSDGGPPTVFVAMWFDLTMDAAFRDGIKPAIEACDYRAERVDGIEHNRLIDDMIVARIRASAFVVADLTGERAGAYFEAGFGYGLGKSVIYTARKDCLSKVHFDANHRNIIDWKDERELHIRLEARILATIGKSNRPVTSA